MFISVPRHVVYGAFDWYGLRVSIDNGQLDITSGRVGNLSHPLVVRNNCVEGGWYIPATHLELPADISRIDILQRGPQAFVMLRSPDPAERYTDEFLLLLSLAWSDGENWYIAVPERDSVYEKALHS